MTEHPPNPPDGHRDDRSRFPEEELQVSARLLLFLAHPPGGRTEDLPPASATQGGLAEALDVSQGVVARVVGRLVEGGVLRVETSHVRNRVRRLKTYHLTWMGETLAERIRRSMPSPHGSASPSLAPEGRPP